MNLSKVKFYVGLTAITLLLSFSAACTSEKNRSNDSMQVEPQRSEENQSVDSKQVEIPRLENTFTVPDGYALVEAVESDIDNDGSTETLKLFVNAETTEDGEIMFDDEHQWLLVFLEDSEEYILFDDSIHNGSLKPYLYTSDDENGLNIHITTTLSSSAAIEVNEYIKKAGSDSFTQSTLLKEEGINYLPSSQLTK